MQRLNKPICIKLRAGDANLHNPELCGRSRLSMHWTRGAAQNWLEAFAETRIAAGYRRGRANPWLFHSDPFNASLSARDGGFAAVGPDWALHTLKPVSSGTCNVNTELLWQGSGELRGVMTLPTVALMRAEDAMPEAAPRHIELIVKDFGLGRCNDAAPLATR